MVKSYVLQQFFKFVSATIFISFIYEFVHSEEVYSIMFLLFSLQTFLEYLCSSFLSVHFSLLLFNKPLIMINIL